VGVDHLAGLGKSAVTEEVGLGGNLENGVLDVSSTLAIDVVSGGGGSAERPGRCGLNSFGNITTHADAGSLLVINDERENDLFGTVAGTVLCVELEKVGGPLGEINLLYFGVMGGAFLVNKEYTGLKSNSLVLVIVSVGLRERAGFLASALVEVGTALLGPVLWNKGDVSAAA
jgi:hypothetical protein